LERRAMRNELRLVAERLQATLHEIRAEVVEQHEAAEQKERDDQDRRNKSNEDVRENQLSPYPPQQPALGDQEQPEDEIAGPGRNREPRGGVDNVECGRQRSGNTADADKQHTNRDADNNEPARQRVQQQMAQSRLTIGAGWKQRHLRPL